MNFFVRWWRGTKSHAASARGVLQTQLIINLFVVLGCFIGAFQVKASQGYSAVAFLLFAFGALNLVTLFQLIKQYRMIKQQEKFFTRIQEEQK